jgi:hypothetical protein
VADAMIEAKADRYVRLLRRMLAKVGPPLGPDDEPIIARARLHAVRMLSMEKGRREARRRRHEMTADMFNDLPRRGT